MSAPNKVRTERREGTSVVFVSGEVDLSWSQDVRREILGALGHGQAVAVELSGVGYIDSSGIAALVEGFQNARTRKQAFALVAVSEPVRAVLELARLDKVFPIRDSLEGVT